MVKHTKTIRRLLPTNCLSVFDHFAGADELFVFDHFDGLAKGLTCYTISHCVQLQQGKSSVGKQTNLIHYI